jgi:hypothetical protein
MWAMNSLVRVRVSLNKTQNKKQHEMPSKIKGGDNT